MLAEPINRGKPLDPFARRAAEQEKKRREKQRRVTHRSAKFLRRKPGQNPRRLAIPLR